MVPKVGEFYTQVALYDWAIDIEGAKIKSKENRIVKITKITNTNVYFWKILLKREHPSTIGLDIFESKFKKIEDKHLKLFKLFYS